jgi:hypothetical protein
MSEAHYFDVVAHGSGNFADEYPAKEDTMNFSWSMKDVLISQAEHGYVKCPNLCHGFGHCSLCNDTGWIYNPAAAKRELERLTKEDAVEKDETSKFPDQLIVFADRVGFVDAFIPGTEDAELALVESDGQVVALYGFIRLQRVKVGGIELVAYEPDA